MILLQSGFNPLEAKIRLNWGSYGTPEIIPADLIHAAQLGIIRPEEFRKNVKFALGMTVGLVVLEITHLAFLGAWNSEVFAAITGLCGTVIGIFVGGEKVRRKPWTVEEKKQLQELAVAGKSRCHSREAGEDC